MKASRYSTYCLSVKTLSLSSEEEKKGETADQWRSRVFKDSTWLVN